MTMPSDRPPLGGPTDGPGASVDPHLAELTELTALLGAAAREPGEGGPTVEEHLSGCAVCQAELPLLERTVGMIEQVPPEAFLDGAAENAELLIRRALRTIRDEDVDQSPDRPGGSDRAVSADDVTSRMPAPRRGRRTDLLAAAAAAALLAGGLGVLGGRLTADSGAASASRPAVTVTASPLPSTVPGTKVASAVDPTSGARLSVRVVPAKGWVRIEAVAAGVPAGARCRLVVLDRQGAATVAGSWLASAAGERQGTRLEGSALVDPSSVAAVRVENTDGRVLVTSTV